jgi:hypothetical protein
MSPLEDSAAVNVELVPFVRGIVDAAPTYT